LTTNYHGSTIPVVMADTRTDPSLGDLQHAIMEVLWSEGQATAAEVHRALQAERGLAPTTIATMLSKMERKGVVSHRTDGRRFVYRATVSRDEVRRSMLGDLSERLFGGSVAAMVAHLLSAHEVDAAELQELRGLIDAAEADDRRERGAMKAGPR
jgi:predicted transcriptional regulator